MWAPGADKVPKEKLMSRTELSTKTQERQKSDLECRYSAIGISAVAAAARYQEPKNKGAAQSQNARIEARFEEAAA
jgi:hypothetical protein